MRATRIDYKIYIAGGVRTTHIARMSNAHLPCGFLATVRLHESIVCAHMHMKDAEKLCRRLNLPSPGVDVGILTEEDLYMMVYDLERFVGADDERIRCMSVERFRREFGGAGGAIRTL